ncbi:MAG: protease complex subunit PrcB family protein [Saccharospirillaceae bacterium]|nr:protease complex subunit PrcB family protein [Pseudomonadales bacterium]NRB77998.1 protease complex subunit PrcB family protein [Saccharospirillaceae bacterium]
MKKLLLLIPFIFLFQGCYAAKALSTPVVIEYEILHESQYNEYAASTSKSVIVIRNQVDYKSELLKRSSAAIKAVNFDNETILLIDMGTRLTGGYTIEMQSLTVENDYVRAQVILKSPGNNCGTTQAITNPFKLIKLKTTSEILITEKIILYSC